MSHSKYGRERKLGSKNLVQLKKTDGCHDKLATEMDASMYRLVLHS